LIANGVELELDVERDFFALAIGSTLTMATLIYALFRFQTGTEWDRQQLEEAGVEDADVDRRAPLAILITAPLVAVLHTWQYALLHYPLVTTCDNSSVQQSPLSISGRCSARRVAAIGARLSAPAPSSSGFAWLAFDELRVALCRLDEPMRNKLYHTTLLSGVSLATWCALIATLALAVVVVPTRLRRAHTRLWAYVLLPLLALHALLEAPLLLTLGAQHASSLVARHAPWLAGYVDAGVARAVVLHAHQLVVPHLSAGYTLASTFVAPLLDAATAPSLYADAESLVCRYLTLFHTAI
jgi:hypothetical protein